MPIVIYNLSHRYLKKTPNEVLAIDDINLNIPQGSFVSIIGHTGSGKSTLIQHLNALLLPEQGQVIVDQFTITPKRRKNKDIKNLRKHVGVVFQFPEYQLFEETVEKDVAFGPRNFGVKKDEAIKKAHAALKSVGLNEEFFERNPFDLSGGEKRRVAIAGILAIEPNVLVLDEPTAGLDPVGQEEIMNLIVKMNKEGKTIILVTHDMDLVLKYSNRAIVLKDGKIAFDGTPLELFSSDRDDLSIETPLMYKYIQELNNHGYHIDINSISSVDDLAKMIARETHGLLDHC